MKYLQLFLKWLRRKPHKDSQSDPEKGAITVAETLIALGIGSNHTGCRVRRNTGAHGCPQPFDVHERADADRDKHPQHLRRAQQL